MPAGLAWPCGAAGAGFGAGAGFACFGSPTEIYDDLQKSTEEQVWKTISMRYEGLRELFSIVKTDDIGYEKNGSWELIENNNILDNIINDKI